MSQEECIDYRRKNVLTENIGYVTWVRIRRVLETLFMRVWMTDMRYGKLKKYTVQIRKLLETISAVWFMGFV